VEEGGGGKYRRHDNVCNIASMWACLLLYLALRSHQCMACIRKTLLRLIPAAGSSGGIFLQGYNNASLPMLSSNRACPVGPRAPVPPGAILTGHCHCHTVCEVEGLPFTGVEARVSLPASSVFLVGCCS
jgi:hypothetical protein